MRAHLISVEKCTRCHLCDILFTEPIYSYATTCGNTRARNTKWIQTTAVVTRHFQHLISSDHLFHQSRSRSDCPVLKTAVALRCTTTAVAPSALIMTHDVTLILHRQVTSMPASQAPISLKEEGVYALLIELNASTIRNLGTRWESQRRGDIHKEGNGYVQLNLSGH